MNLDDVNNLKQKPKRRARFKKSKRKDRSTDSKVVAACDNIFLALEHTDDVMTKARGNVITACDNFNAACDNFNAAVEHIVATLDKAMECSENQFTTISLD
jgi:hypothetical protein